LTILMTSLTLPAVAKPMGTAEFEYRDIRPKECLDLQIDCRCYAPASIRILSNRLYECQECQAELDITHDYIKRLRSKPLEWYQDPVLVVGGTVVGVGLGVWIGLLLSL